MQTNTVQRIISKSLLTALCCVFIIIIIISTVLTYKSNDLQVHLEKNKSLKLMSDLLTPSITISDTTEIRRLLRLASTSNEFMAVVDDKKNIFLDDYNKDNLTRSILPLIKNSLDCRLLQDRVVTVDGKRFVLYCIPIISKNINYYLADTNQTVGLLLEFSNYQPLWFAVYIFIYFILIATLSSIIVVFMIRNTLQNRILKPLYLLKRQISFVAKGNITDAPEDINSIKSEFDGLLTKLDDETNKRIESEKLSALYHQAKQVAHDIRSPLLVLDMTIRSLTIPDKQRSLITGAAQRISGIADDLLNKNRHIIKPELIRHNLITALHEIVSEKKIELGNSKLTINYHHRDDNQPIFSKINLLEFKRAMSNLVNNAAEAIKHDNGIIRIKLIKENNRAIVEIADNGCGIPPEILASLSSGNTQHLSHNKINGNGLGVHHAIASIRSWLGTVSFQSEVDNGTTVIITLPISE